MSERNNAAVILWVLLQKRMADSIGLSRKERNEGGNGEPKQSLNEKEHESPKTHFLNPAFYVHFLFRAAFSER